MKRLIAALAFVVAASLGLPAAAVEPDEVLADAALEQRARDLSHEIRCVVCQNESIDSSNAELAKEMRILVRERLVAGDSDQQVLDYLVARYGDFVLLRPPVKPGTYVLWFGPAVITVLGILGVFFFLRRQRRPASAVQPLSAEEEARLARLLDSADASDAGAPAHAQPGQSQKDTAERS
ncbi:cytochrome c-type biogenesis protein [Pelagibius sp.]|uniref:cytochrome c-type biogenesis protein n=1 Tax=Pelagibius sp. TaxID=1931238 RepID=UPI0026357103|nr:cytochrome c-type biogenesis protein [Pelagibius sp.]